MKHKNFKMVKIKNLFAVLVTAIVFLSSCVKTTVVPTIIFPPYYGVQQVIPQNEAGEFAITFGGYTGATMTKASVVSTSTTGYDSFNLYSWNSIGETIMSPYKVLATGENAYDYSQIDGQQIQYFRNAADNYEFIGVIPQELNTTISNNVVTVEDVTADVVDDNRVSGEITADSNNEFLWAYKKVEKAEYGSVVNLPFMHGNALLYLGFKSDRDDTELLDYTPYTPGTEGTPGVDAWDEIVEVTTYSTITKPVPMLGPVIGTITDEDIDYINSKYTSSLGWLGYYSDNSTFTGSLDENMWEYLVSKHPELTSEDLESWGTYADNSNMRLVHVDKNGKKSTEGDSYRGWFVNVQNVNFNTGGTTHQETIHHDAIPAIPGTPATGIQGIRVFSANYEAEHYLHVAHTTLADAQISAEGLTFDNRETANDVITFTLPETTTLSSTPVFSPTTFYAIPGDVDLNNFVVKFSYTYKGTTVYDVRVPLTLPEGGLVAGKYYKYIINITSVGNGHTDPTKAEEDADEIDVVTSPVISVTLTETGYTEGIEETVNI